MITSGYNIIDILQEAQIRWLKPGEVHFILQNFEELPLANQPPQKPPSASLFLFNKRVLRFFRKDGHNWRRKKNGRVGEAHERLKVGNVEALNCYYAHGELNPNFQRRSYSMLDQGMDHIVLVHYRDITMSFSGHSLNDQPPSMGAVRPLEHSQLSDDTDECASSQPPSMGAMRPLGHSQLSDDTDECATFDAMEISNEPTYASEHISGAYVRPYQYQQQSEGEFAIREIAPEWGYASEHTKIKSKSQEAGFQYMG